MNEFRPIFEIRISGRDIIIDGDTWSNIQQHVRNNKWFYVIYMDRKYKYTKDQTFYYRPTRFDFELVNPDEEEEIDIIYIN